MLASSGADPRGALEYGNSPGRREPLSATPDGNNQSALLEDVLRFRWRIVLTYGLTLLENVFLLLYPFAFGLAINGLINGDGWRSLLPLLGIWLAHIATGACRQLYDTRLFTRIYADIAGSMILRQRAEGEPTGGVTARSAMTREAVDFFEYEVPGALTSIIGLLGGIAMLFVYHTGAGAIMAGLLLPVLLLSLLYGRRALALSNRLNNRYEREVDAIESHRPGRVHAHFRALSRWRVRLSDSQVGFWSTAEFLTLIAVMVVVYLIGTAPGAQAGDIFAALAYALAIVDALDTAPDLVEQLSRLVDIRRRVDRSSKY